MNIINIFLRRSILVFFVFFANASHAYTHAYEINLQNNTNIPFEMSFQNTTGISCDGFLPSKSFRLGAHETIVARVGYYAMPDGSCNFDLFGYPKAKVFDYGFSVKGAIAVDISPYSQWTCKAIGMKQNYCYYGKNTTGRAYTATLSDQGFIINSQD